MSSLSHSKLLLFFDNETELLKALDKTSALWKIFMEVRRWSEEEDYSERVTWIECFGIHPKCWSFENINAIGEKWGQVLHIDHDKEGVNSLTFARLMVKTKTKITIKACIKMEWEGGYCDVQVREATLCECMSRKILKQCEEESNCDGLENPDQGLDEIEQLPIPPRMGVANEDVGKNIDEMPCNNPVQMELDNGENGRVQNLDIQYVPSQDEVMLVVNSSTAGIPDGEWFDPILSVECSLNTQRKMNLMAEKAMSTTQKRLRGRPKRNACSLPIPLYIPPSPSVSNDEAHETWNVAKSLGVNASDEEAVIRELRKSKRLQKLEENPNVG